MDPDKPKRPQSAYFIWMNENRSQLKEQFPGISITELTKKAGEMWKEMTDKSVSIVIMTILLLLFYSYYTVQLTLAQLRTKGFRLSEVLPVLLIKT